jgi:hypothetical protein
MRRLCTILFSVVLLLALGAGELRADSPVFAITGRVVKVLPLFLDTNNAVSPSPSLFDRDAYQARLREHTNEITGIRFDVLWKAHNARGVNLKLCLEIHGVAGAGLPTRTNLVALVTPKLFNHWTSLTLNGPAYKNFGDLAAWRATLWNGTNLLGEQKSFLWSL